MFFNRSKLSRYGIVEEENDMIKVHVKKISYIIIKYYYQLVKMERKFDIYLMI